MTTNAQQEFAMLLLLGGTSSCAEAVNSLRGFVEVDELKAYASIRVTSVRTEGDRASVPDSSLKPTEGHMEPDGNPSDMTLVRRGDRWPIDELG
jgi:hypothetical protein